MIDLSAASSSPILLSPLDSRYREATAQLVNYLSEAALNRYRLHVEIEWIIYLANSGVLQGVEPLTNTDTTYLRDLVEHFGHEDIAELAGIEAETRHDVKAIEYYLKARMDVAGKENPESALPGLKEMAHIFCTSEDINNIAWALAIKEATNTAWLPEAKKLYEKLASLGGENADLPMLAHTHGQPATPTTVGKEIAVFAHRLHRQIARIEKTEYLAKFSGATGTFGAHEVSVPGANWPALSRGFVEHLGLTWNPLTTQIEPADWMADLFADIQHANRIAHNLATDMWTYISLDYFHQNLAAQGSTGSSTMPHKVNPIRFENAEANFEISSALLGELAQTLVTSRMQRDLTDSSTKRNIGVAFGHSLLALNNLIRGLSGVDPNPAKLRADLDNEWEVLGEPIQQAMRALGLAGVKGLADPYERLKELTRGRKVTGEDMRDFIRELGLPQDVEARLLALTPATYTGLATQLVDYLN